MRYMRAPVSLCFPTFEACVYIYMFTCIYVYITEAYKLVLATFEEPSSCVR